MPHVKHGGDLIRCDSSVSDDTLSAILSALCSSDDAVQRVLQSLHDQNGGKYLL